MNVSAANSSFCAVCVGYNYSPLTITIIVSLTITGLVANILLLVAHHKDPLNCFRNVSTYFIHNIAINDCLFIVLASVMVVLAGKTNGPVFFKSKYIPFVKPGILFCTSVLNISLASQAVERFTSVAYPFFHHVYVTRERTRLWFGVVWIAAFVSVGVAVAIRWAKLRVAIYLVEIAISLPCLTVMFAFYIACFVSIKRQQKRFKESHVQADLPRRSLEVKLRNEQRFLTTILIVSVAIIVLWLPAFVFLLPDVNIEREISVGLYKDLNTAFSFLVLGQSLLNPFIYLWRLPKYRKSFLRLYCGLCKV